MNDKILNLTELVKAQSAMIKMIICVLDARFPEPKFSDLLRKSHEMLLESQDMSAKDEYFRALQSLFPPQAS